MSICKFSLILLAIIACKVSAAEPELKRTDFMTGLQNPWDMAFTQNGVMFFTEKCRGLSVRHADGRITRLFGTRGSQTVAADMFCEGQSGMHGVALDPNFATTRNLYVFMPSNTKGKKTNHVVRLKVNEQFTQVSERTDIIKDIEFKDPANSWGGAGSHSGGRVRFGPDGFLYVTSGDNHNGPLPQDLNALGGKVLRVDREGVAAPGNGIPVGGDARIYTYGHRNPQGISFHPGTGRAYVSEHGPNHSDEVTPLSPGGNSGWDPKPERGVTCAENYCGYISNKATGALTPMTDLAKFPNALKPLLVQADSQGMSAMTFVSGAKWKDWNGAIALGYLAGQRVEFVTLNQDGTF